MFLIINLTTNDRGLPVYTTATCKSVYFRSNNMAKEGKKKLLAKNFYTSLVRPTASYFSEQKPFDELIAFARLVFMPTKP